MTRPATTPAAPGTGRHFWAVGYGAWSTGNVTEEAVRQYLEHHRHPSNREADDFIME